MGQIMLLCGAPRSERAKRMDALWHEYGDKALLLAPTPRAARARLEAHVRQQGLRGVFGARAWELTDFARFLLENGGRRVRMLSMLERRLIVLRAVNALPPHSTANLPHASPGLVRHLLRVITQLKQAAIEPAAFREAVAGSSRANDFDGMVAQVYDAYQQALIEDDRYDIPGLYWEATGHCAAALIALPNGAEALLLDGFDDFTPSQQRFIEALSAHATVTAIGLNYDCSPDRVDMYHLQQRWVENFCAHNDAVLHDFPTDPPENHVQYIGRNLFWRTPPPPPTGLRANFAIVPCADAHHEMEFIARRVKALLRRDGVAPGQIAVCLADMERSAAPLRDILTRYGVPVAMRTAPTLSATSTGAFVMRIFDALYDWERNAVTALLASPLIKTADGEKELVKRFPRLARNAGIVSGKTAWERLFAQAAQHTPAADSPDADQEAVALLAQRFEWLTALADALPEQASPAAFARTLDVGLRNFRLREAVSDLPDADTARLEMEAVDALEALLEQIAKDAREDTLLTCAEFARLLVESMGETSVPFPASAAPGVYCCGLDAMRHERFAHVFIGGLNEGTLPRPAPINAVYSESDLRRLQKMNLSLAGQREHACRERLVFCHAIEAAQDTLTLLWRKLDMSGRETLPSPFITEIKDIFSAHDIQVEAEEPEADCFVPAPEAAASARELANALYYRNRCALRDAFPEIAAPLERIIAIETQRNSDAPFGVYDGCIQAGDLLEWLGRRYGDSAQFSAYALEKYCAFPFAFFMEDVLKTAQTEIPDAELTPMARGNLAHDTLRRFHKRFVGESVAQLLAEDDAGTRRAMRQCVGEAFRAHEDAFRSIPDAVAQVERRRLEQALHRYLDRAADDFGTALTPRYFEAAFGRAPREDGESLNADAPFALVIGDETFLFTGRIDRIDVDDGYARIVDYKSSGTPAPKAIKAGLSLQLSIYAWAVEHHLLPDKKCSEAYYYSVYRPKKTDALLRKKEEEYAERQIRAQAAIVAAVHGIRAGQFPPLPHEALDNWGAVAHTAARYEEWRIARKCSRPVHDEEEEQS